MNISNSIVLFDKHLATLGGGESHALRLLEELTNQLNLPGIVISPAKDFDVERAKKKLNLKLENIEFQTIPNNFFIPKEYYSCKIFINATHNSLIKGIGQKNILLTFFPMKTNIFGPIFELKSKILSIPNLKLFAMASNLLGKFPPAKNIDSYDLIIANSEFTKSWIKKYWNKDSEILYPSINLEEFANDTPKQNKIIAVGRFFKGNAFTKSHNKKQEVLIEAFKKLVDENKENSEIQNLELNLVGSVSDDKRHLSYLEELKILSTGYKINFHISPNFETLKKLYAESLIFWHATGYGINEEKHPEQMEHFGITTVEAMSAGCIPIVINKGGQKEIVKDGENGFLWNTIDELVYKTKEVFLNKEQYLSFSKEAKSSVSKYNQTEFQNKVSELINTL